MKLLRQSFAFLVLIGASLLITPLSFVAGATAPPDRADIFKKNCTMCHGADGKGFAVLKTPNFIDPKWQKAIKDKEIEATIKNGKKGTAMPAFGDKLKEDEIRAVMGYIRSLGSSKKK